MAVVCYPELSTTRYETCKFQHGKYMGHIHTNSGDKEPRERYFLQENLDVTRYFCDLDLNVFTKKKKKRCHLFQHTVTVHKQNTIHIFFRKDTGKLHQSLWSPFLLFSFVQGKKRCNYVSGKSGGMTKRYKGM